MSNALSPTAFLEPPIFDDVNLSVTLNAACYGGPRTFYFFQSLKDEHGKFLPVATQMFKGYEEHVLGFDVRSLGATFQSRASNISSVVSIHNTFLKLQKLAVGFADDGFEDLSDVPEEMFLAGSFNQQVMKPVANAVLQSKHAERLKIAQLLYVQRLPTPISKTSAHLSDDEIQILRDRAWNMFKRIYDLHADYTKGLAGWLPKEFQTTALEGRNWHDVPAEVIIAAAQKRAEETIRPRGDRLTEIKDIENLMRCSTHPHEAWDWLLLNPTARGGVPGRELFFGPEFRCAAMVHHAFIDLRGYNAATMMSTHVDKIQSLGDDIDYVDLTKPRAGNLHSREFTLNLNIETQLGGFLRAVAAVSKFSRYFISQWADPKTAGLLYAGHHPTKDEKLNLSKAPPPYRFQHAIREDIEGFLLRWGDLRLACDRLGQVESPDHELHGQTKKTRTTYDKKALKTETLHSEAEQAVEIFVERGYSRLRKAEKDDTAKDLAVSVCVSGTIDPDHSEEPCQRPLTSCFSCPNSLRTFDHIPGLLTMQRFCLDIQESNAFEWETSEASSVLTAVTAVLEHAPAEAVDHWRTKFENEPLLAEEWDTYIAVVWRQRSRK